MGTQELVIIKTPDFKVLNTNGQLEYFEQTQVKLLRQPMKPLEEDALYALASSYLVKVVGVPVDIAIFYALILAGAGIVYYPLVIMQSEPLAVLAGLIGLPIYFVGLLNVANLLLGLVIPRHPTLGGVILTRLFRKKKLRKQQEKLNAIKELHMLNYHEDIQQYENQQQDFNKLIKIHNKDNPERTITFENGRIIHQLETNAIEA